MEKPMSLEPNKLLHVYGKEIISSEEIVSRMFSEVCALASFERPSARPIHTGIRVILSESAIIGQILFPLRGASDAKERARILRAELGVKDTSLLNNRILRNHLAHLDERLDSWAAQSERGIFGRGMLGSRLDAIRLKIPPSDILGIFDPDKFTYSFWEDDLQLDDLVGEVRAVSHDVRRQLRSVKWGSSQQ